MPCRGVRGATVASANTPEAILGVTRELLLELVTANGIPAEDIGAAWFTATSDLNAAFPASAARSLGWKDVALLDAQSVPVPGDVPRCIRVLILWNTAKKSHEIEHVYLGEAARLRPDRMGGKS